jgi:LPS-assembly lipoprotein
MRQLKFMGVALLVGLGIAVSGCSHRPLYGKSEGNAAVASQLADVSVEEQRNRAGQLVRNELISGLGSTAGGKYLLKMTVVEKTDSVSSVAKNVVDRHRYRLTVTYQLLAVGSGDELAGGKSFSNVSFDTVQEPVADLQAAENARDRAARELAQDLRMRIAAFFATRNS